MAASGRELQELKRQNDDLLQENEDIAREFQELKREFQELKRDNQDNTKELRQRNDDLLLENRLLTQGVRRKRARAAANVRTDHNGIACGINMLFFFSCCCTSGRALWCWSTSQQHSL